MYFFVYNYLVIEAIQWKSIENLNNFEGDFFMKSRRVISLLAVAALATTIFVGCGNKEEAKESGL